MAVHGLTGFWQIVGAYLFFGQIFFMIEPYAEFVTPHSNIFAGIYVIARALVFLGINNYFVWQAKNLVV